MKKVLVLILCSFILGSIQSNIIAQNTNKQNIYIEVLGPSNLIGISYDTRLNPGSNLGYRIGVAYTYNRRSNFLFDNSTSTKGYSSPAEINYLFGKKENKFEVGIGTNLGLYRVHQTYIESSKKEIEKSTLTFGYYFFSNIGYRYQPEQGLQYRVGISPSFSFGDSHSINKSPLMAAYLSVGYVF